jgi:hypothetical protein
MSTESILAQVAQERQKQKQLWGSEYDLQHGPNDWSAIAGSYLNSEVSNKGRSPDHSQWRDSMIKAAAVIIAALEHEENMCNKGCLSRDNIL